MKKLFMIFMVALMITFIGPGWSLASAGPAGPAPNSGDGISDGSGLDSPNGPNSGTDP